MYNTWDRYTSPEMSRIFSEEYKYRIWRRLWYLLASQEKELGLNITDEQVEELGLHLDDADINRAKEIEKELHHDVMAHLRHYAEQCPKAAPIIHLGATSCYITDNADYIIISEASRMVYSKLHDLISEMCCIAMNYKDTVTVGRTHFQPAQPTTVGKRVSMWVQDFTIDLRNLMYQIDHFQPLGCKGATGTCDSFLKLFNGNSSKVEELDYRICAGIGDLAPINISGQTYTRKQDFYLMQTISGIAQSASKMATDVRLLSGLGEIHEPFGRNQVGSSAMPYKKNPMLCERICGLSRFVICNLQNVAITASSQWLERSLDDSSNRRVVIPEMFIAIDAILNTCIEVARGINVDCSVIQDHLYHSRLNTATEGILMYCTDHGGDRQKLHEKLRQYAIEGDTGIIFHVMNDPDFNIPEEELKRILESSNCGIANKQVSKFIQRVRNYEL